MKILHLLSQRPDSTGSGIYLQAMLREAAALGHRNFLVAGIQSKQPAELGCIDEKACRFVRFVDADISYNIVGMSDVMPYESNRFCDLSNKDIEVYEQSFSRILADAVATFNPDIIHSHHLWLVTALARKQFPEIPMVTTCHGSDLRQFQACRHLQEKVLSGCRGLNAVMALSEIQKQEIQQLYQLPAPKIVVVGAGYNDALFTPGRKPDPQPVRLMYAGKLSHAKGLPWFLRALAEIDSFSWQLDLAGGGSGEEKENCLNLAAALGRRVVVHGAVSQEKLANMLRQAHIFVLPSLYEGLPLVVLEALASGCRIVSTAVPGIAELLGDVRADFIQLVALPRRHHLDRPLPEDERQFVHNLQIALASQMSAARRTPDIALAKVQGQLNAYTWSGVFRKVLGVYKAVCTNDN